MDKCCMINWYWVTCQQSRMVSKTLNVLHGAFSRWVGVGGEGGDGGDGGDGGEKLKLMLTQSICAGAGTELGNKLTFLVFSHTI